MTAPTGHALKLKCELAELARRHNVTPVPHTVPLLPAAACSMVLKGFASTGDLDFDRCRFAPFSFGLLRKSKTRLLYAHDEKQIAGEIEELSYDPYGRLLIKCRVDHEQARRCNGFSVGGRIRGYKLVDADKASFHAVITDCELSEVSLVERPANRFALVKSRWPVGPHVQFYKNMEAYVAVLNKLVTVLPQLMVPTSGMKSGDVVMRKGGRRTWPSRGDHMVGAAIGGSTFGSGRRQPPARGSFSELAAELNNRSAMEA